MLAIVCPVWSAAAAQSRARAPVRAAVPDSFPVPGAKALVLRYAGAQKPDVIMLNSANATPEALAAAIAFLQTDRRATPAPEHDEVITVTGFAPARTTRATVLAKAAAKLAELHARPVARIGNLGPGRWLELADATLLPR